MSGAPTPRKSRLNKREFVAAFLAGSAVPANHVRVAYRSFASEFPHDNAAISAGAAWICEDLVGPATAELLPAPPAPAFEPVESESFVLCFDEDDGFLDGPLELDLAGGAPSVAVHVPPEVALAASSEPEPEEEPHEEAPAPPAEPELSPAYACFESALVTSLLAQGATRSAALVPLLLRLQPIPAEALAKDVQLTLQSRGYLDGSGRYTSKYRELCSAWTAVLSGASQDFAACGTTTLDRFGADLLAALLAVPATRADELRRGLRKAGIAAFGVLEHAA